LLGHNGDFLLNQREGRYYGNIVNDRKEGIGTILWSNGSKFTGLFVSNRAWGIGKYTNSQGGTFVGN